ncbi:MAG: carboxypeptidase regulatory-like domain-containing protein [candidate division Zixibacteria bacterium]|jgi:hypothetical protein|nr:carboxypeptidase regulatory-like domain-containing protein [candidate division Zixibacteria bacterium]
MLRSTRYLAGSLSVIVVIGALLAGCAKKPANIKGTVVDNDGKPLGGAAVLSVPQRYSVLTDTLGNFIMERIEPGQYSLLVRFGNDSTLVNIGTIEPGEDKVTSITLTITPPPPPPPLPEIKTDTIPKAVSEKPIRELKFVDPIVKEGTNAILLCIDSIFAKYEVESSDNLNWELRKTKDPSIKFKNENGRMTAGYFSGPRQGNLETAAGKCIYDGKLWIYAHGPDVAPKGGRTISIAIPIELEENMTIDSLVVLYGIPPYASKQPEGSVQFRALSESAAGKISILIDWQRVDHSSNGAFHKKVVEIPYNNRYISYITLEIDSDGEIVGDDFLIRPILYYTPLN